MTKNANDLHQEGWRLLGWGFPLKDSLFDTVLVKDGVVVGHWTDGVNTNTGEAYGLLGVEDDDEGLGERVLFELNELSQSERGNFPQFVLSVGDHRQVRQKMEEG